MRRLDISQQRFGRLVALRFVESSRCGLKWRCLWEFQCDCGNRPVLPISYVTSGDTRSCGCLQREVLQAPRKHGRSHTAEFRSWTGIRQRCGNPTNPAYRHYGGRGISLCERWQTFENFYADMGPKPSPKHSIERIDNDKGYYKDNCRWATAQEQANNRRSSRLIQFNGETRTLAQWCVFLGVPQSTLWNRLNRGVFPGRVS